MATILNVPIIDQTDHWPTGCETVSTVMVLNFFGINITVDDFIKSYLRTRPMHFDKDPSLTGDILIGTGPDPSCFFAGDPYREDGFGCFPGVILEAMNRVLHESDQGQLSNLRAMDGTGLSEEMLIERIHAGLPVIYWTTLNLEPSIAGPKWIIEDTGEIFYWTSHEHCMVLCGYDESTDEFFFNDPWEHHGRIQVKRSLSNARHAEMGNRAVILI